VTRGLIFDLDGTLVHSLPGIAASLNRALAGMGMPGHPDEAVRSFVGNGAHILATRALPPGSTDADVETLEAAFKADYAKTWPTGSLPYPGIVELLRQLQDRGELLGVLSNKPHPFTTEMVAALFPGIHFTAVVGQKPGVPHKPDPAPALALATELGVPPGSCFIIGDSTIDLETAHHAGMRSVAVTWGYHNIPALRDANPDEIANDPRALGMLLMG
jgi:phosphoglycolate phosphatase